MVDFLKNNRKFFLYFIPSIAFFIINILILRIYAVNVLYRDEWAIVNYVHKVFYQQAFAFEDIFKYFHEHPIAIAWLIHSVNYFIKPFSQTRLLYVSQFLILLMSFMALFLVKKDVKINWSVAILVPASLFSLTVGRNFIVPWQIHFIISLFFFVAALTCMVYMRDSVFKYVISFILCVFSLLSAAWGLVAVTVLFFYMFIDQILIKKKFRINSNLNMIFWGIGTLLLFVLYFMGYSRPSHFSPIFYVFYHPIYGILFFSALIGAFPDYILAKGAVEISMILSGMIITFAYFYFLLKRSSRYPVLITLSTFGILSAIILTIARGGDGDLSRANACRNLSFTMFASIGLIFIVSDFFKKNRQKILNIAIVCVVLSSFMALSREVASFHNRLVLAKEGLRDIVYNNDYSNKLRMDKLFGGTSLEQKKRLIGKYFDLNIQMKDLEKPPKIFKTLR